MAQTVSTVCTSFFHNSKTLTWNNISKVLSALYGGFLTKHWCCIYVQHWEDSLHTEPTEQDIIWSRLSLFTLLLFWQEMQESADGGAASSLRL